MMRTVKVTVTVLSRYGRDDDTSRESRKKKRKRRHGERSRHIRRSGFKPLIILALRAAERRVPHLKGIKRERKQYMSVEPTPNLTCFWLRECSTDDSRGDGKRRTNVYNRARDLSRFAS